ncbi:MAG: S9 family peptidase [Planctomycetota bacterium]
MPAPTTRSCLALTLVVLAGGPAATAQLDDLPGWERVRAIRARQGELRGTGPVDEVRWSDDGATLSFTRGGQRWRFDLADRTLAEVTDADEDSTGDGPPRRRPPRGRQFRQAESPDGRWIARCVDYDVVLDAAGADDGEDDGDGPVPVTTDGERKLRYGMASWVYGEELRQLEAMWWSPDSTRLAFYEFDERDVEDFHLLGGLTERHTRVLSEGYPKPGEPNPVAGLLVHHVATGETVRVDVGPDREQYVYRVRFRPDGSELLFSRTSRRQDVLELVAADPATGATRVILTERQETWQENRPEMRFLDDGVRFVWATEKTGFRHYELWHLDDGLVATLTGGDWPVQRIEHVDEDAGVLYFTAFSGENPLNAHLHRVALDGSDQRRLTQEPLNHSVNVSPDGRWFLTRFESVETPPATALYTTDGERIATLAESDRAPAEALGLQPPELFSFTADDGETDLYGVLYRPSDFDPSRTYPLVVNVYGGPLSRSVRQRYRGAEPLCELGFVVAAIDNRGTSGRGKAFESATYLRLGTVDLKDQVDGVAFLARRPWIDGGRVGIIGHSYGGYMAALALLRFPDVFHVAVAGAAVTDWRNYDTIYTERFMRTPEENPEGYDAGSCLTYVDQLRGRLLLLHGMVDDNVHPTNAWQLVDRLQRAGKRVDTVFYPSNGHRLGRGAQAIRWRYLYDHLVATEPATTRRVESAARVREAIRQGMETGPGS